MKKTIFLLCVSVLASCSKSDKPIGGFSYSLDLNITLKNSTGDDLLGTPNYNPTDIKIYNRINGQAVEVYNPTAGAPRNFMIITETTPKRMRLFPNDAENELYPITYIQWNATDTDTIMTHYAKGENYKICDAAWLNGEPIIFDSSTTMSREFTIVK